MRRLFLLMMSLLLVAQATWAASAPSPAEAMVGVAQAAEAGPDRLPAYQHRFGRTRPLWQRTAAWVRLQMEYSGL